MLPSIVRAVFVVVVCCLLAGSRPAPAAQPRHDDPGEARLDATKTKVELVAPRRDRSARDPRDQRTLAATLPVVVAAGVPPARAVLPVVRLVSPCAAVAVVDARSSRGPPVG